MNFKRINSIYETRQRISKYSKIKDELQMWKISYALGLIGGQTGNF